MLNVLLTVMIVVSWLGVLLSILMLERNKRLAKYLKELLDEVSVCARLDIAADKPWEWRYKEFANVSYSKMLHKFWKPFDSFYPDKSFIKAGSKPAK